MNWWILPENAATFGQIDTLYLTILIVTGVIFVIVEAALLYFVIRYRRRDGRRAEYITGSTRAEVVWTVAPLIILLFLAFYSRAVWLDLRDPARFPQDAFEVVITARQFEWNVTYPGEDGRLGTDADFVVRNRLNVPVNRPVIVRLRSDDVIHSFFVREFRVKQDAVPGMETPIWFEATQPGEYALGCAELCGLGHYRMRGTVVVMPQDEFESWHIEAAARAVADRLAAAE